jgi:hypothetical protein
VTSVSTHEHLRALGKMEVAAGASEVSYDFGFFDLHPAHVRNIRLLFSSSYWSGCIERSYYHLKLLWELELNFALGEFDLRPHREL